MFTKCRMDHPNVEVNFGSVGIGLEYLQGLLIVLLVIVVQGLDPTLNFLLSPPPKISKKGPFSPKKFLSPPHTPLREHTCLSDISC